MYHVPYALQYIYMDAVMKEVKMGIGRSEVIFMEDVRECRLPSLFYAHDYVLCCEL